jgi:hypothetical protein
MMTLWHELDMFEYEIWENPNDSAWYKKKVERTRVFVFLAGLNKDLDEIRGRILGKKPLSSIREVFSEIQQEEAQRQVMLKGMEDLKADQDGSALAVRSYEQQGEKQGGK